MIICLLEHFSKATFTDLIFAGSSMYIVWSLQMKLTRRLDLAFLLGLCLVYVLLEYHSAAHPTSLAP